MLVELLRTKPWLRRVLSGLSVLLVLGGLGLVGYPFATNMWTDRIQSRLELLEREGLEQNERLQKLEAWREEALAQRAVSARQVQTLQILLAVSLSLAGMAILLSILFFTRSS